MSTSTEQLVAELKSMTEKTTNKFSLGGIISAPVGTEARDRAVLPKDADAGAHKLQDKPVA